MCQFLADKQLESVIEQMQINDADMTLGGKIPLCTEYRAGAQWTLKEESKASSVILLSSLIVRNEKDASMHPKLEPDLQFKPRLVLFLSFFDVLIDDRFILFQLLQFVFQ